MLDHFFPLLFPKDSKSLKIFDIRLREVGAKRRLNGTSKVNRQTNTRTDRQTHRQTNRLINSIGPEGPCFENNHTPTQKTTKKKPHSSPEIHTPPKKKATFLHRKTQTPGSQVPDIRQLCHTQLARIHRLRFHCFFVL